MIVLRILCHNKSFISPSHSLSLHSLSLYISIHQRCPNRFAFIHARYSLYYNHYLIYITVSVSCAFSDSTYLSRIPKHPSQSGNLSTFVNRRLPERANRAFLVIYTRRINPVRGNRHWFRVYPVYAWLSRRSPCLHCNHSSGHWVF